MRIPGEGVGGDASPKGVKRMPTYISLLSYTEKGMGNVKDSPARLDAARKAAQAMGAKIMAFYLVMGQYDAIVISEAPNDETVARFLLATGALGNIRTQTFRAFTEDEYRKIVAGLP